MYESLYNNARSSPHTMDIGISESSMALTIARSVGSHHCGCPNGEHDQSCDRSNSCMTVQPGKWADGTEIALIIDAERLAPPNVVGRARIRRPENPQ